MVYPAQNILSSPSLGRKFRQKENGQIRQPEERRLLIERKNDDVVNQEELSERVRDGREAVPWWNKKNVERRIEGNPYKRNHKDPKVIPYWYKRNAQKRRYEQKSDSGIPYWYKRDAKILHVDGDRRSDDRSTGLTEREENTEKRGNEACVMHYNQREQTWCCTICKYCGKLVVKHC